MITLRFKTILFVWLKLVFRQKLAASLPRTFLNVFIFGGGWLLVVVLKTALVFSFELDLWLWPWIKLNHFH